MSTPSEHDYIGLSEPSSMERSSDKFSTSSTVSSEDEKNNSNVLMNFKETELRLGLPGSESPERKVDVGFGVSLFRKDLEDMKTNNGSSSLSPLKNFVSGAKRGFSDTIDGSGKWVFSVNGGSEPDLGKNGPLFSPRGGKNGLENSSNTQQSCLPGPPSMKEAVPPPKPVQEKVQVSPANQHGSAPAPKAQVIGWPPIRSFRKNTMATTSTKNSDGWPPIGSFQKDTMATTSTKNSDGWPPIRSTTSTKNSDDGTSGSGCLYVKVSMDGAPYLRKVDLKTYSNYVQLSSALEKMFSCFTIGQCGSQGLPGQDGLSESHLMDLLHGSEYVLTYEDKDGDWMLVGDVPWEMFTGSCKRLRIMKGSEAIGLAPRAMEKCKHRI